MNFLKTSKGDLEEIPNEFGELKKNFLIKTKKSMRNCPSSMSSYFMLQSVPKKLLIVIFVQKVTNTIKFFNSAGAVEYTDCISAEE